MGSARNEDAGQTITVSRSAAMSEMLNRRSDLIPLPRRRNWRETDPPSTTVDQLSPDDFGKRVVIRSGNFLGTVYGTLLDVHPHPTLSSRFTCVMLYGKRLLTFRNNMEVVVLDEVPDGR